MTVIAIAEVGPQGVVQRSSRYARAPAVRVDSTVVRLIGFPGDPLVQSLWRPFPGPTRLGGSELSPGCH